MNRNDRSTYKSTIDFLIARIKKLESRLDRVEHGRRFWPDDSEFLAWWKENFKDRRNNESL